MQTLKLCYLLTTVFWIGFLLIVSKKERKKMKTVKVNWKYWKSCHGSFLLIIKPQVEFIYGFRLATQLKILRQILFNLIEKEHPQT